MAEKLKRGEFTFQSVSGLMLALKWCDKKEVWMLLIFHAAEMAETTKINYKKGKNNSKPTAVIDYNKNMREVDKSDMTIKTVKHIRKSTKWYKNLFFHILDMAVYNAYCLYTKLKKKHICPVLYGTYIGNIRKP